VSFPSPGRGAAVVEALAILDRFPPELLRADSPDRLHVLVEACRLAHADSTPLQQPPRSAEELATDAAYIGARASLIRLDRALSLAELSSTPLSTLETGGTTQVSVADAAGAVVSLTQTLGNTFGALVGTEGLGFAYNNLISGFELDDARKWRYARPFLAPRTGMAPTILLENGAPYLAVGSAGSDRILSIVVNVVSNLVDRRMPLCEAITAARALWSGMPADTVLLELVDPITAAHADALAARGFAIRRQTYPAEALALTEFGGANAVLVAPDGTVAGAGDPRRQGVAVAARPAPPPPEPELTFPACWRDLYYGRPAASR
jgi:gamma-glutamyltranspeptidase/glutathione hydrolase